MIRTFALLLLMSSVAVAFGQAIDMASVESEVDFDIYRPIQVDHQPGTLVQVIVLRSVADEVDISFLGEQYVIRHSDHTVWCAPPGKYLLNADGRLAIVTIHPENPEPDPDPDDPDDPDPEPDPPDVPDDEFDNLGQRVAKWTAGLPANKSLGECYKKYAEYFTSTPLTVNEIFRRFNEEKAGIDGIGEYTEFGVNLGADIERRWPMTKGVLRDYFLVVARGLGVN